MVTRTPWAMPHPTIPPRAASPEVRPAVYPAIPMAPTVCTATPTPSSSRWLPWRLRTLDSFLAGGVVVCSVGPLELVDSGLRESRESGSPPPRERRHGHGLLVRDVPSGPSSRADDELRCVEGVQALRRAVSSLSRLPDGGNPADLCQARGLADVGTGSRHPSGPDRGRTRDRHGTCPGGAGPPRGERGPSSPRRPASRRSCGSWRRRERRRPSLRWCGRRSGPRLSARADVPTERPGEQGRGRRRHHGVSLVVTPRRRSSPPHPGHCHEPGDLVPPDVVAGFLRGDDMSAWIPYLRNSPTGGPNQKRARRDQDCVPAPEPTGAGSLPRRRCAGHQSVRQMGSAELLVYLEGGRGTLRAVDAAARKAEA